MKVFQIIGGFCHWDATAVFPTAEATVGKFPPTDLFVDAPDYVFEGWGYDPTREDPFVKPEAPEGWLYDDASGTFYKEGETPPMTDAQRIAALEAENKALKEQQTFLEDCILEMADVVYA